jgi:hypothetical protein
MEPSDAGAVQWCSLDKSISAEVCRQLQENSFVVIDDALDKAWATSLHHELQHLATTNIMVPNKVQFQTSDGAVQITKPNIFEADMHDPRLSGVDPSCSTTAVGDTAVAINNNPSVAAATTTATRRNGATGDSSGGRCPTPEFRRLFLECDHLINHLNLMIPTLQLATGLRGRTVKLQYNGGNGGSFPWHYDNPTRPNNRRITCLVYLNPDWMPGHGGELQLLPFLRAKVTVAPIFNRMVMFESDRLLHRVQPSWAPRLCFTIWLDSLHANSDADMFLREKHLHANQVALLERFPLQRTLSRAVYKEAYEQSLCDCFGPDSSPGTRLSLALHSAHLLALLNSPGVSAFVETLRRQRRDSFSQ